MIIIAKLNYYKEDGGIETKILPMEANSPKDAYEKVNDAIQRFRKDSEEYRKWKNDVFSPTYAEISGKLSGLIKKRILLIKKRQACFHTNEELDASFRVSECDNEISKINQERKDLYNSRQEPSESSYASFKLQGLETPSGFNFLTLNEWLKEKIEIYI